MADSKVLLSVVAEGKNIKIVQGQVENLAKSTNKAGNSAENLEKKSRNAERGLKGASEQSANATKNFSKMAQGMGGLVGVYASLAAQIFAITAAFNFLKDAGDLKTLQASQEAYAANTGFAMRILANDLVDATNAQISFKEASQAAAIGTAAGLSPVQLKQLSTAAKDLSLTLGRDVTDSFNRLVRGVTKAEPELLDELGIILRLEDAQREYGLTIGKSAKDLTQFEKSQAVVNKVLQEANRVSAIAPDTVNVYNQLGKAFDDILIELKRVVDAVAGPVAKALIKTPELAILSFGLLVKGPLAALGISFQGIGEAAQINSNKLALAAQKAREEYARTQMTIESTTAAIRQQSAELVKQGSNSKIISYWAEGGAMTPQARATIKRALKAAEKNVNEHGVIVKGIFKGISLEIVRSYSLAMEALDLAEAEKVTQTKVNTTLIKSYWASTRAFMGNFAAFAATWGSRLLSAFGWISIVATGLIALNEKFEFIKRPISAVSEELQQQRERVEELNKEYKDFLETQQKLIDAGRQTETVSNVGNVLGMLDTENFRQTFADAQSYELILKRINQLETQRDSIEIRRNQRGQIVGGGGQQRAALQRQIDSIAELNKEYEGGAEFVKRITDTLTAGMVDASSTFRPVQEFLAALESGDPERIERARVALMGFGTSMAELPTLTKNSEDALGSFVQGFAPLSQGQRAIEEMTREMDRLDAIAKETSLVQPVGEAGKRYSILARDIKKVQEIEERIFQSKLRQISLDKKREAALANIDKLYQPVISKQFELLDTGNKILDLQTEKAAINTFETLSSEQSAANDRRIKEIDAEIELLNQRSLIQGQELLILTEKEKLQLSIRDLRNDAADLNLTKQSLDLQNKELSTLGGILKVEQELANIRAERAERDFTRNTPFADVNKDRRLAEQAYELEKSLVDDKIKQIRQEYALKKELIKIENALLVNRLKTAAEEARLKVADLPKDSPQRIEAEDRATDTAALAERVAGSLSGQIDLLGQQENLAIEKVLNNLDKLKFARDELQETAVLAQTLEDSIFSGFSTALDALVTGTSTVKEAFANMATSILKSLSKVITEMLTVRILQAAIGGLAPPTPAAPAGSVNTASLLGQPQQQPGFTLPGFAKGGIMSNGKMMTGYASGGVATGSTSGYPAMLHGTEAIVPLPDGRSIPVEMTGGSSQQNNVTVNVAIDNQGNATTDTSQQGPNIGNIIAQAVQKELQNQKRAGGILSPYGAA